MKVVKVLFVVGALFGGIALVGGAQAMTYQDTVDVQFVIEPTLSISLSADSIVINDLVPGNNAHSNTVLVDVTTNNIYGYALSAKVGGDMAGASASNSLVNGGAVFSSLGVNDNLVLADFNVGTWGYTTASSISDSSTTYSGLLYNTDTIINMTTGMSGRAMSGYSGTNSTSFTIGASASNTQASGRYTNVISFTAVTNNPSITIHDLTYMQDFVGLSQSDKNTVIEYMAMGSQYSLKDQRDDNVYTISKLEDGNVWMTQNLDFCIGCSGSMSINSTNTDLNAYDTNGDGSGTYFTDYSIQPGVDGNIIYWNPSLASTNGTVTGSPAYITSAGGTQVTGWTNNVNKPYMMDAGDLYSYQGTRYESLSQCEDANHTRASCNHYKVGNFYNWSAAVAMSDTSSYTAKYTVMPNSVCPAGWRLPNGLTNNGGTITMSDFNALAIKYGIVSGTDTTGGTNLVGSNWSTTGYVNMGLAPLFFARAGNVSISSLDLFGTNGVYWSSTVIDYRLAYSLTYNATAFTPANANNRVNGRSIRCILR